MTLTVHKYNNRSNKLYHRFARFFNRHASRKRSHWQVDNLIQLLDETCDEKYYYLSVVGNRGQILIYYTTDVPYTDVPYYPHG
jgi:hypothetical protein